jgi:hypothetical protein
MLADEGRWNGPGACSHHRLGVADDFQDADADQGLTFAQACGAVEAAELEPSIRLGKGLPFQ